MSLNAASEAGNSFADRRRSEPFTLTTFAAASSGTKLHLYLPPQKATIGKIAVENEQSAKCLISLGRFVSVRVRVLVVCMRCACIVFTC